MPVYTDQQTGKRIRSDEPLSDAELDEAFGGGQQAAAPQDDSSGLSKAFGYVKDRITEFGGALQRLTSLPSRPDATMKNVAMDALTVGGPALAATTPLGAAGVVGGLAAGAATRAAGGSERTAALVDAGTNLGAGLAGALRGGIRSAKSAADVVGEGEQLGARVPAMKQTVAAVRRGAFDPILAKSDKLGLTLGPNTSQKLGQALLDAQDEWGSVAKAAEKRVLNGMLDRVTSGTPVTPREVDDALKTLNMSAPKAFATKRALGQALDEAFQGTPLEGQMSQANRLWHSTLKQGQYFADQLGKTTLPGAVAQKAIRLWNQMSAAQKAIVDPNGEVAALVKSAARSHKGGIVAPGIGSIAILHYSGALNDFHNGNFASGMGKILGAVGTAAALRYPGVAGAFAEGAAGPAARGISGAAPNLNPALPKTTVSPPPPTQETPPEAPGSTPEPTSVSPATPPRKTAQGPLGREMEALSQLTGVPVNLARVVIQRESGGRPGLTSDQGARGLMQLLPSTFDHLRPQVEHIIGRPANIDFPLDNMVAGFLYLKQGMDRYGGDVAAIGRWYHGGPDTRIHGPKTQAYGDAIAQNYAALEGQ